MVRPEKEQALLERMRELGIAEEDIVERFIRSSGKGGQKVNKTSTCVYLKHVPSGIEVKMQQERSQAVNRFLAKRLLVEKIEDLLLDRESARQQEIAKIRRQKRKRSRRTKEKILKEKKLQSEKKKLRQPVDPAADS